MKNRKVYKNINLLDSIKPVKNSDVNKSNILKTLKEYEETIINPDLRELEDEEFIQEISNKYSSVLTPDELNEFVTLTETFEGLRDYHSKTGLFISDLMQKSYNSFNNNFNFNTNYFHNLGYSIKGSKERPISLNIITNYGLETAINSSFSIINIKRNYGDETCAESNNIIANIKKNYGGYTAAESKYSLINIKINRGEETGVESEQSHFNIKNNYGINLAVDSKKSNFNIKHNHHKIIIGVGSEACIFKSANSKTLDSVDLNSGFGNKTYLINKNKDEVSYTPRKHWSL